MAFRIELSKWAQPAIAAKVNRWARSSGECARLAVGHAVRSGAIAAGMTQYLTHRFLPVAAIFQWEHWRSSWWAGAIAGALVVHVMWVVVKPRARASRAAALCALANVVVCTSFLIVSPPLDDAEFRRIETRRLQRDAASSGTVAGAHRR